jgi:hypothetical protein
MVKDTFDRSFQPGQVSHGIRNSRRNPGAGSHTHHGSKAMLKTVILVDDETHEEIRQRAIAASSSWAAQARMLLEVGLETLKADGQ